MVGQVRGRAQSPLSSNALAVADDRFGAVDSVSPAYGDKQRIANRHNARDDRPAELGLFGNHRTVGTLAAYASFTVAPKISEW